MASFSAALNRFAYEVERLAAGQRPLDADHWTDVDEDELSIDTGGVDT